MEEKNYIPKFGSPHIGHHQVMGKGGLGKLQNLNFLIMEFEGHSQAIVQRDRK